MLASDEFYVAKFTNGHKCLESIMFPILKSVLWPSADIIRFNQDINVKWMNERMKEIGLCLVCCAFEIKYFSAVNLTSLCI